jgi:hypothetical protein
VIFIEVRASVARVELARGAGGKIIAVEPRSRQTELPLAGVTDISTARGGEND